MNSKFTIDLIGDVDLEGMAIEINFDNQAIARLDYEKGVENIEMEIFLNNKNIDNIKFPLSDFLVVVEKAKKIAIQCAKEDEQKKQSGKWI